MLKISGETTLIGLLGEPVSHSLSPAMQNAAIAELDLDWCYVALPCPKEDLEIVLKSLRTLNFKGLNITIPHKENVAKFCSSLSPISKRLQATNTLTPNEAGGWNGTNTDITGFTTPLKGKEWDQKTALVIGSGGSARAVVAGLQELKLGQITIISRKITSLNKFLVDLKSKDYSSTRLQGILHEDQHLNKYIQNADLIVNTTPIGMKGKITGNSEINSMPLGNKIWEHLESKTILYDLIYTPRPTAWLKYGEYLGCELIDGLEMLVQQGAASLRLWSNQDDIPIEAMRKAAKSTLNL